MKCLNVNYMLYKYFKLFLNLFCRIVLFSVFLCIIDISVFVIIRVFLSFLKEFFKVYYFYL